MAAEEIITINGKLKSTQTTIREIVAGRKKNNGRLAMSYNKAEIADTAIIFGHGGWRYSIQISDAPIIGRKG
ncbi:MAG: hypothetical protein ABIQ31_02230 [Ferruginibacter sp.]